MPAEIDTMQLISHIDRKFGEADEKRRHGLELVHAKIDAFRGETTAALGEINVQIGKHDTRIGAIESSRSKEDAKSEGRLLAAAKIILSGGGLAALYEVLRGRS